MWAVSAIQATGPTRIPTRGPLKERRNPLWERVRKGTATGIRTPVSAVRGRRPSPLDDGGSGGHSSGGVRVPKIIWRLGGAVASWVRGRPESAQSADARGRLWGGVLRAARRRVRVLGRALARRGRGRRVHRSSGAPRRPAREPAGGLWRSGSGDRARRGACRACRGAGTAAAGRG